MKSSKNFPFQNSRPLRLEELESVYRKLRKHFGHQHWWPGETPFEIIVGAILTQNTAWSNVEKAIINLKKAKVLTPKKLKKISKPRLSELIRPAGYFNVKADRLKCFTDFLFGQYSGSLKKMFKCRGSRLREQLLEVKGIGPETADSILLYAGQKPFFVIDAYTKRIFSRHRLKMPKVSQKTPRQQTLLRRGYEEWQNAFSEHLPVSISLYNDYHAQIVALGKEYCRTTSPRCGSCPMSPYI